MENQENPQEVEKTTPKTSNNKLLYIIIGLLSVLILALIGYMIFSGDKTPDAPAKSNQDSTQKAKDTVQQVEKADSTKLLEKQKREYYGDYYEGGGYEKYPSVRVIANSVALRSQPKNGTEYEEKTVTFGQKLYAEDYYDEPGDFIKVYLTKPADENNPTGKYYYIRTNTLIEEYSFENYKESFSLSPFKELHSDVKRLIMSNDYSDRKSYKVSQNSQRVKTAVAQGDFDSDGIQDLAVVLDNNESQVSRLLVICHNKATKKSYLAYSDNYDDIIKISGFKKGAKIYKNSSSLIPSPSDGIIISADYYDKRALLYNPSSYKFQTFYQSSEEYGDAAVAE